MVYPNGRTINYDYGGDLTNASAALDNAIGRLDAIVDGPNSGDPGQVLEQYSYLGLSTIVARNHPQTGINLTLPGGAGSIGSGGDQYAGLDQFGRVVNQNWKSVSSGQSVDNFTYSYDANSNVTAENNLLNSGYSQTFTYDPLNRLGSSTLGGAAYQSWTLGSQGNWNSHTIYGNTQTQTANAQNQITSVSGGTAPTYDSSGNALGFTPDSAITEYLYNQQYYDVISGQYYMRARNYDPATGTFTQQDSLTINPGDLANANLFLFAGAEPINMFDPSGHIGMMDVLTTLSLTSFLIGMSPIAAVGLGSVVQGSPPDALGFGVFFDSSVGTVPQSRLGIGGLVGAELTLFPRAKEAQISFFGPADLEPAAGGSGFWQWVRRWKEEWHFGVYQSWNWGAGSPGGGFNPFALGGAEIPGGIFAGLKWRVGTRERALLEGYSLIGTHEVGLFGAGGVAAEFPPFRMSEGAMIATAAAGEGLFNIGFDAAVAGTGAGLMNGPGGLGAATVSGGLTGAWVGWTYGG